MSRLVPGLQQLRRGDLHWAVPLLLWLFLLSVVALRWRALPGMWTLGMEGLAIVVLVVGGLVGIPALSARTAAHGRTGAHTRRSGPGPSSVWARAAGTPLALTGWILVTLLLAVALLAPLIAPADPSFQGDLVGSRLLPPGEAYPLGTDPFARDVLSRLIHGTRLSLGIAVLAVAVSVSLGVLIGGTAGYVGGWVDGVLMRGVDLVLAFPRLVLLIALVAVLEPSTGLMILVLGFTQWPPVARLVRGEVLSLREREFVQSARMLGISRSRILFRHILPAATAPVLVAAALGVGDTIVLEAGLSFLGLGVQPPAPSWGAMVADGRNHLPGAWWLATFPGVAIVVSVVAFNLAGDGLRAALDPKEQGP